jgi:hypothetical protein
MGPKTGSIQQRNAVSGWLAHVPLWVVVGLGALVMFASETPEAARAPLGRIATGEIGPAPVANPSQFAMPRTLTGLGRVPSGSGITDYTDPLTLTTSLEPGQTQSIDWPAGGDTAAVVHATPGLAALRHSHTQQLAMRAAQDMDLVGQDDLGLIRSSRVGRSASLDDLIQAIDPELMADEITGSSSLIDLRHRQHKIADFLARYYRRSKDNIRQYVRFAYESAQRNGVDPLLVIGIMCVESSLNPKATSHKDARGLMQVLVKAHVKRFKPFGGTSKAYDPRTSIEVGTRIIAGMIKRTGSVKKALKYYVGAANFRTDGGYGNKVIGMRDRVWAASLGKRIPAKPNIKLAIKRAEKAQAGLEPAVKTAQR